MRQEAPSFISTQVSSGEYYYLNLTPDKAAPEAVVCGGREQCAPRYRIERNGFRFSTVEFVTAGKGMLTLQDKSHVLTPGAIFWYGPRIRHVIETDPAHPLLKHFVSFTGGGLLQALQNSVFEAGQMFMISRPFRINSLFESLIETGNGELRNRDALCCLLLRQIILLADSCALEPGVIPSHAWQTYLRCRQYIEQNASEIPTIRDVADACAVNQAYLTRLFKRFAEETPLQLLTRLKMAQAAGILRQSDMPVKQVAERTGFDDPYHFSRVFKRVYGVPPRAFARIARRID